MDVCGFMAQRALRCFGADRLLAFLLAAMVSVWAAPSALSAPVDRWTDAAPAADTLREHRRYVRTVTIDTNVVSFEQAVVDIVAGETVRFKIHNRSEIMHQFAIGAPGGEVWSSIDIPPGETVVLTRTFAQARTLEFACHLHGHYERGMHGAINVMDAQVHTAALLLGAAENAEPASEMPTPPTSSRPMHEIVSTAPNPVAAKLSPHPTTTTVVARAMPTTQELPGMTDAGPKKHTAPVVDPRWRPIAKPTRMEARSPGAEQESRSGTGVLQLASLRSARTAEATWRRLARRHADILNASEHFIVRADLGTSGVFYRLRVRGFQSRHAVRRACELIRQRGDACVGLSEAQGADDPSPLATPQRAAVQANSLK